MGSRNGVGPLILRARRGFEPTRWQVRRWQPRIGLYSHYRKSKPVLDGRSTGVHVRARWAWIKDYRTGR